jgi:hypothetical protein
LHLRLGRLALGIERLLVRSDDPLRRVDEPQPHLLDL